jgi:hypothetical protein
MMATEKEIFIHHKNYGTGRVVHFSPFMGVGVCFSPRNVRFFSTAEHNLSMMSIRDIPLREIVNREIKNPIWHARNKGCPENLKYTSMPIWPSRLF